MLDLARPIYQKTSYFGHFGREDEGENLFTWEKLDKVEEIKKVILNKPIYNYYGRKVSYKLSKEKRVNS